MGAYKSYDHRLKILVIESKDLEKYKNLQIPKSTMRSWITKGINPNIITLDIFDMEKRELYQRIIALENLITEQELVINLIKKSKEIFNLNIDWVRFPQKEIKEKVINMYNSITDKISPKKFSELIGISLSRLKSWRLNARGCELEDFSSCPKSLPTKATGKELKVMESMIKSDEYSHIPISNLAVYAQKMEKLFFSPSTWLRYAKEFQWARERIRKYSIGLPGWQWMALNQE